jgi:hypothetical protein
MASQGTRPPGRRCARRGCRACRGGSELAVIVALARNESSIAAFLPGRVMPDIHGQRGMARVRAGMPRLRFVRQPRPARVRESDPERGAPMILRIDRVQTEMPPPSDPDPVGAARVQELMGGRFGEMSTLMNYTFQSFNFRNRRARGPSST